MRHLQSFRLLAAVGALSLAGCANMEDSPFHSKLGMAYYELDPLFDWNWPSAQNLGPLEAPKRLRPEPTAIGVNWATDTPLWGQQSPTLQGPSQSESHAPPSTADESSPPAGAALEAPPASVDLSVGAGVRAPVIAERR